VSAVAGRGHLECARARVGVPVRCGASRLRRRLAVLEAILPPNDGPTAVVPIAMGHEGLELVDGVEAKEVLVEQSRALWR
jgi:hypothetical protein